MVLNIPLTSLDWCLGCVTFSMHSLSSLISGQHERQRSPWLNVSTAHQQLEHQCVDGGILILNQNHGASCPEEN